MSHGTHGMVEMAMGAVSELSRRGGGPHTHLHGLASAGGALVSGAAWVAPGAVATVAGGTATVVTAAGAALVAAAPVAIAAAAGYGMYKLIDWIAS